MHIIVIGCGKVGSKFAQVLSDEGHDVVIVDSDASAFRVLDGNFNGITVVGVPIDQDVLKAAGIESADALAAVTPDDNRNIMVCQMAKEIFKVPKVVARIYNPEREHVFHQFGLETICPTDLTVDVIRSKMLGFEASTEHHIANTAISFTYKMVHRTDEGKKLSSIHMKEGQFLFGVVRNEQFMFYNPNLKIGREDILVVSERARD